MNDEFDKLPEDLRRIVEDEESRKKLVIYINPPYAEAASTGTISGTSKNKSKVATENNIVKKYKKIMGASSNEIFAQFLIRIYKEIPNCIIAEFSKLKVIQSPNFKDFRNIFLAKLEKMFVVPADTFDNVKGKFPIGFFVWNTLKKEIIDSYLYDIYDENQIFIGNRKIYSYSNCKYINDWYKNFYDNSSEEIGIMNTRGNDFQNYNYIRISSDNNHNHTNIITKNNLLQSCIYLSVRHCIEADWLNDRDQFLYPKNSWEDDTEFQNDCVAFTLFHSQNRISSEQGVNHWIPFTENELNAKDSFASHFMTDFLSGKIKKTISDNDSLFSSNTKSSSPLKFSSEANAVFEAGLSLWKYYHSFDLINVNASYYDIRAFFQKFNDKGRMNPTSKDETYNSLLADLKRNLDVLAQKIAVKVYEHGFLKE